MRLVPLFLVAFLCVANGQSSANWTANYAPCDRHSALLSQEHLDLGVKLATANPILAEQFRRAMDSWATILDLGWHEDNTKTCAMELVDGDGKLFQPSAIAARSQFPDRINFQGWIAFNPKQKLSEIELYRIALHEIGHMLGLKHSSNVRSVMYGYDLDDQEWLDPADLAALAEHHKLRIAALDQSVKLARPPGLAISANRH